MIRRLSSILLTALVAVSSAFGQPSPGSRVTICNGNNCTSVTASNALKVDGSAVTQPVSGTVSAAQSGTWNINNLSGTVSLPTGASTAALQTTLNTIFSSAIQQDQIYTSANGVFAIGWDDTNGVPSAIPISAGTIPVSGSIFSTTSTGRAVLANVTGTGTTGAVNLSSPGAVYIGVRGTYSGLSFTVEGEADSGSGAFITMPLTRISSSVSSDSAPSALTNATRFWQVNGGESLVRIRLNVSAFSSGTANFVYIQPANASLTSNVSYQGGVWDVGANIADGAGNKLVSNTAMPAAGDRALVVIAKPNSTPQPVSQSGTWNIGSISTLPSLPAGSNLIGGVNLSQVGGNAVNTGNGSTGTGTQRVTLANDSTGQARALLYDSAGNAIASANTTPGGSDRGAVTRSFSYLYDSLGNALTSVITAPALLARALVNTPIYNYNSVGPLTLSSAGTSQTISSGDYEMVEFTLSGTHTNAGLIFELNYDGPSGGTNWTSTPAYYRYLDSSASSVFGTNLKHSFRLNTYGLPFRIRCTSIASGSVTINAKLWRTAPYTFNQRVWGSVTASVSGQVETSPYSKAKTFFEGGNLDFVSIPNSPGTFYTTSNKGYMIHLANTTDVELGYSLDGGNSYHFIPSDDTDMLNLMDIGGDFDASTNIEVYYPGPAAPTRGRFSFLLSYY